MKRALVAVALVVSASGVSWGASDHTFGGASVACGENGTISWGPTTLWPPNHKLHTVSFTYTDADADNVSLAITAKPHSDTLSDGTELNGSGNTPAASDQLGGADAAEGTTVTVDGAARGERSGHSMQGRTYRYEYVASSNEDMVPGEDDGCASDPMNDADDLTVFVPHDCRGGACKP